MFLHPFSTIIGFTSPEGKGVYVRPFDLSAPSGWGDPKVSDKGEAIFPGTPGGPNANALLYKVQGKYKSSATKYKQLGGNITWWGPLINAQQPAKGRIVFSYFGPKLRYFRDPTFTYGSVASHNDIYYLGGCTAIAPGPVTGACYRSIPVVNQGTGVVEQIPYLFVAVYKNGKDEFYRKKWLRESIRAEKLTDEVRKKMMGMRDTKENPNGWDLIGTFDKPTQFHFPPETPWFFNEAGNEAVNVRRKSVTFNNGNKEVTEDYVFDRLVLTINSNGDGVSIDNLGTNPRYQYREEISKIAPTYTSTDLKGYTHSWNEDHVKVTITVTGDQYVLGDYIGNVRYWGKIKYDILRKQEVYYTEGTDPQTYNVVINGTTQNISNKGLRVGPRMHNFYEYGFLDQTYVPAVADHEYTIWILIQEQITLYYGPDSAPEQGSISLHYYDSGTSDEWAGNPRQSNNPYIFYYKFYTRYLRGFLDIRDLALFSYDLKRYGLWQDQNSDNVLRVKQQIDIYYTEQNIANEGRMLLNNATTSNHIVSFGWPIATMDTWSATISQTLTRTTYMGQWFNDNFTGTVQAPGSKTFYAGDQSGDLSASWPTIEELLFSTLNSDCKGNGVRTERTQLGFSLEVPDTKELGKYNVYSMVVDNTQENTMLLITGYGLRFHPVGAC